MTVVALRGCRATPLLPYLQALGVLRLLHEQCTPGLTSYWEGTTLHIDSDLSREHLVAFFLERYQPTPVLSPWNNRCVTALRKGSGTGVGTKGITAIANSEDSRFETMRITLGKARELLELAVIEGWADGNGKIANKPKTKKAFLTACRAIFPDEALGWLDTATVLSDSERLHYPLILGGAGGVLGSGDLSLNFLDAVADLLLNRKKAAYSKKLLAHALFGDGHPKLHNRPVGQYAPGAAGTVNSSAFGSAKSVTNLWSFVLGMEGALIFSSGVARRFGGSQGLATTPFTVQGHSAGYSAAEAETVRGEFWAPLWQRPMSLPELRHVIAEGRLSWRGQQASNGLDAAKALSTLGVDRGFSHFERYVIAKRFGDLSLAAPVGSFVVTRQPADRVSLLSTTDTWVARVRRQRSLPQAAGSALRRVDAAQMKVTQNPSSPALLQDFLVEFAALEWTVSRNPRIADAVGGPIRPLGRERWGPELDDGTVEWRLAAALATQRDRRRSARPTTSERRAATASVLFRPVMLPETHRRRLEWDPRPSVSPSGSVTNRLAAAVIARTVLCADRAAGDTTVLTVGSGGLAAFDYAQRVRWADVDAFLNFEVDDRRLNQLLSAAALLDGPPRIEWPQKGHLVVADPARAVLGGFYHSQPVVTPATDENPEGPKVLLLPGRSWPQKLHAGRTEDVFREALVRLRAAGFEPAVRADWIRVPSPNRLLASLLIPTTTRHVQQGIYAICPPTTGERPL